MPAFDQEAFNWARRSSKLKTGGNIKTFYYDPYKDVIVVEFADGTVRQIAYSLLQGDKYKETREAIAREISRAGRIPGHLVHSIAGQPNAAAAAIGGSSSQDYLVDPFIDDPKKANDATEPWICEWLNEHGPDPTPTPAPAPRPARPEAPRRKRLVKI